MKNHQTTVHFKTIEHVAAPTLTGMNAPPLTQSQAALRVRREDEGASVTHLPGFAASRTAQRLVGLMGACRTIAGIGFLLTGSAMAGASGSGLDPAWVTQAQSLATQAAQAAFGERTPVRVEVMAGTLDPRLRLAPCARTDIFLPTGHRPWGRTRIGLRCLEGPTRWSVTLPLTVKVWAPAWVAAQPLPSGTVLQAHHLRLTEVDWAAEPAPVLWEPGAGVGRALSVPRAAGEPLRQSDLRAQRWFEAGETVILKAVGPGFAASGSGVALTVGLEGQSVRVRTAGGRTVTGRAVGDRLVEVLL
jgi:flagella basal body P-ring formation protein FlgA